jgi:hypothetical protein
LLQLHVPVHARHLQRRARHGAAKLHASRDRDPYIKLT